MCASNDSESEDEDNQNRERGRPARKTSGQDGRAPTILLVNRQRLVQGDWNEVRSFLGELCSTTGERPFSVCLTSDRAIRRYNKQYRHQDQATDVLSFPSGDHDTDQPRYLGDIVISVETARENAARYGIKLEAEIKILALHGVLHLMGFDHETDRGRMARAEKLWCARLGLPAPLTMRSRASRRTAVAGGGR